MDLDAALTFARAHRNGVLVTLKADGRPQSSNIIHTVTDDGRIRISITADRAKYKNLVRDPRVSLHVNAEDFWSYVVLEADAELTRLERLERSHTQTQHRLRYSLQTHHHTTETVPREIADLRAAIAARQHR